MCLSGYIIEIFEHFLFLGSQEENGTFGKRSSQEGKYLPKSCHVKNGLKHFNISLPILGRKIQTFQTAY